MLRTNWIQTTVFAAVILVAFGAMLCARQHNRVAATYYAQVLYEAQATERVWISGSLHTVEHGSVSKGDQPVHGPLAWRAVRLAYQTTLARRDPLLAIPGTDPDALSAQLDKLRGAQEKLAEAQTSKLNATLIGDLYPIAFLRSIATLEKARQTLLAYPTEDAARAYDRALQKSATKRGEALDTFVHAFTEAASKNVTIAQFAGLLTKNNQLRTLFTLQDDAAIVVDTVAKRIGCVQGSTGLCRPIPTTTLPEVGQSIAKPNERASAIAKVWDEANGTTTSRVFMTLPTSACISALPGPYRLALTKRTVAQMPTYTLSYADEIYFIDTEHSPDSFWQYARHTFGIAYSPVVPFTHYSCPRIGIDLGMALAYARIHTLSATSDQDTADTEHLRQEYALMLAKRTAGLEYIVADIVRVIGVRTDPSMRDSLNTVASYEFLTHSAFPTFFRIGASSDTIFESLYTQDAGATEGLTSQLVRYDIARQLVGRQALVEDIAAYLRLENRLNPNVPSSTPVPSKPK